MTTLNIDYTEKRVLLVESSGNMRATIVQMLRQLGISNIQAITINDKVMDILKEEVFDIVMIGHNVSDSYSGMQILEECRYRGYIRPKTCWVFMTSDSSQEVILHAVDNQPDVLITKPFSMDELKARLDLLIYRKHCLKDVDDAIAQGRLDKAIKLCDEVELAGKNYDYVQLIKGRLLLQTGRYEEAEHFFKYRFVHLSEKESGVCLAEAFNGQGKYKEAKELLNSLIEKYPLLMGAYDLLAQVLEHEGQLLPAQDTLIHATKNSPLSMKRHMELGRVAVYNQSLDVADTAYRKSISLNDTSCYRSAEPFLKLANIRRLELSEAKDREKIELANDFEALLNTANYKFSKDPELKVKTALLRSQMSKDLGNIAEANRHLTAAKNLAHKLEKPVDLQRMLLSVSGDKIPLLEGSVESQKVKHASHDPAMSVRVNRLGVKHYMAGKVAQSTRYFGLAIENDPENCSALLNLAQLFLESARKEPSKREERLKMVQRYLRLAKRSQKTSVEKEKLNLLLEYLSSPMEKVPNGNLGPLLR